MAQADTSGQSGFEWQTPEEQSGNGNIIVGDDGGIAAGQHRILGGLMSGNPVPYTSITYIGPVVLSTKMELYIDRNKLNFASHARAQFAFMGDLGYVETASLTTLVTFRKGAIEADVYHGRRSYEIGFGVTHDGVNFSIGEFLTNRCMMRRWSSMG